MNGNPNGLAWWLTGFTDGEGCFSLWKAWNRGQAEKAWRSVFVIGLRADDEPVLQEIRAYWGDIGRIHLWPSYAPASSNAKPTVDYRISSVEDLCRVVIPHFEQYPLRSKKQRDFAIWKQGTEHILRVKRRRHIPRIGESCGGYYPKWKPADYDLLDGLSQMLRDGRRFDGEAEGLVTDDAPIHPTLSLGVDP